MALKVCFLGAGSPQNVYRLPRHPNFHLKRCPRPKQICDHPNNEPDKISHPARASPDSRSTASQIEFAIGTAASTRRWRDGRPLSQLDGVPATIKDNILVSGLRATWGSRLYADFVPDKDETPPQCHDGSETGLQSFLIGAAKCHSWFPSLHAASRWTDSPEIWAASSFASFPICRSKR
jgi:hypothetical protein